MQQKINSLGVDEFQISDITKSKTPNNIEIPSTNASQNNKVYQNQFIKIDTSNISKNNNSPNYISDEYLNTTDKKNTNNDQENDINNNSQFHTGRWTEEEHRKFIDGILEYGNEWKKVQQIIKTRSSTQVRSHAQKFF
jgi:SHAQKYF class myb-like DNA-binding protein